MYLLTVKTVTENVTVFQTGWLCALVDSSMAVFLIVVTTLALIAVIYRSVGGRLTTQWRAALRVKIFKAVVF